MAGRQSLLKKGTTVAASAASLLLSAWFSGPAIASPYSRICSDDIGDANLDIRVHELKAASVSYDADGTIVREATPDSESDLMSPAHRLLPRAEAAVQEAFKEVAASRAAEAPVDEEDAAVENIDGDELPVVNTRFPGVTDTDLARYRRQMYRIDI